VLLAVAAGWLGAQAKPLPRGADFKDAPGGPVIGALVAGAPVTRQEARAGHTRVLVEGFVEGAKLGGKKGKYAVHVAASGGAALRGGAAADAREMGTLRAGTGLAVVSRTGAWVKVRRGGWVPTSAMTAAKEAAVASAKPASSPPAAKAGPAAAAAKAPPATAPATATPAATPAPAALVASPAAPAPPLPDGALVATKATELRTAPDGGATLGTIAKDALLVPLARERGWVRVRVEGWVREQDAAPADTAARSAVSAADLRADPQAARGRIVRWEVEIIAYQVADPLRKDLTPDEPYLLARGPGRENALLYLAVPPSLVTEAKAFPPLGTAIITARVRTGRSDPTGVPVLDLQQIARK
jgi:hypothetical protein